MAELCAFPREEEGWGSVSCQWQKTINKVDRKGLLIPVGTCPYFFGIGNYLWKS